MMDSKSIFMPKAVISICNSITLNIWDIRHGVDDEVLVGLNNDIPKWHVLRDTDNEGCYFVYADVKYSLLDAMKLI